MTDDTKRTFTKAEIRKASVCTWPCFNSMVNQNPHTTISTTQQYRIQQTLMACCNTAGLNIHTPTELRCLMTLVESNHLRQAWDEENHMFGDDVGSTDILSSVWSVFNYPFPNFDEVQHRFLKSPISYLPLEQWSHQYTPLIHWYCRQIWQSFSLQKSLDSRLFLIDKFVHHLYDCTGTEQLEVAYSVLLLVLRDKRPSWAEWDLFKMHLDRPCQTHRIVTRPID